MYEKANEDHVVLESVYIEMDPIFEGFEGVLVELAIHGEMFVLTETAAATGNQLLRFCSADLAFSYELLHVYYKVQDQLAN